MAWAARSSHDRRATSLTANSKNGSAQSTVTTTNSYAWWDGPVASTIVHNPNTNNSTTWTTTHSYSASGQLVSAYIGDGRPRTVTFTNDIAGQVIRRDEADNNYNSTTGGDPHEIFYRYGGKQLGYTGNNGTLDTDYLTSADRRTMTPGTGAFRFGGTSPSADFDQSLDPINSYGQGSAGGSYTARSGDTLASIAANLWGDSSLWYRLAEANGLSGPAALAEGQTLNIPSGVMKSSHNASTFKPYDAAEAMGDLSPTAPKPPKKAGACAVIGQILIVVIVVIAVAVSAVVAPWATGLRTIQSGSEFLGRQMVCRSL